MPHGGGSDQRSVVSDDSERLTSLTLGRAADTWLFRWLIAGYPLPADTGECVPQKPSEHRSRTHRPPISVSVVPVGHQGFWCDRTGRTVKRM
jgi:hypothetical protein